jgi:HK97 family phage portal protein
MLKWLTNLLWSSPPPAVPARGKAVTPDSSPAWRNIGSQGRYIDPLTELAESKSTDQLYDLYRFASILTAPIRYICTNMTAAPLTATIHGFAIPSAPQLGIIGNSEMTQTDMLRLMALSYYLTGAGYALKLRGGMGEIVALAYLPSTVVKPIRSGKIEPLFSGYRYESVAGSMTLDVRDLVAVRNPDPADPADSMPLVLGALREIGLDEHRISFWMELLSYCPIPGLAVKSPTPVPVDVQRRVLDEIINSAGLGRRGGSIFLPNGMDAEVTDTFGDNFEWESFTLNTEARICAVFGVPPQLLGLESGLKYSTYSNYSEARKAFFQNTMRPLWCAFADALTRSLCDQEGDLGLKLAFDTTTIPEMNEHTDEVELYTAGILTLDEVRARLGYPAVGKTQEAAGGVGTTGVTQTPGII